VFSCTQATYLSDGQRAVADRLVGLLEEKINDNLILRKKYVKAITAVTEYSGLDEDLISILKYSQEKYLKSQIHISMILTCYDIKVV